MKWNLTKWLWSDSNRRNHEMIRVKHISKALIPNLANYVNCDSKIKRLVSFGSEISKNIWRCPNRTISAYPSDLTKNNCGEGFSGIRIFFLLLFLQKLIFDLYRPQPLSLCSQSNAENIGLIIKDFSGIRRRVFFSFLFIEMMKNSTVNNKTDVSRWMVHERTLSMSKRPLSLYIWRCPTAQTQPRNFSLSKQPDQTLFFFS